VLGVSMAVFVPGLPPVQFLVMPTVLLASFRLGPLGAALSTVIVAIVGSIGTVLAAQAGASSSDQVTLSVFTFQLQLATLFLTALPIGSAMAQRSRLEQNLTDEKERADRFAREMVTLVNVDDLTGLATRRHFLDQLDTMAATARRVNQPLTLAMIGWNVAVRPDKAEHFLSLAKRTITEMPPEILVAVEEIILFVRDEKLEHFPDDDRIFTSVRVEPRPAGPYVTVMSVDPDLQPTPELSASVRGR